MADEQELKKIIAIEELSVIFSDRNKINFGAIPNKLIATVRPIPGNELIGSTIYRHAETLLGKLDESIFVASPRSDASKVDIRCISQEGIKALIDEGVKVSIFPRSHKQISDAVGAEPEKTFRDKFS